MSVLLRALFIYVHFCGGISFCVCCFSGVLDVAGGKGELAFELVNLHSIKSCVIDPRPTALKKFVQKYEFGIFHR